MSLDPKTNRKLLLMKTVGVIQMHMIMTKILLKSYVYKSIKLYNL